MAFAVIKTGGKQYVVKPGDVLEIEKLELEAGAKLSLETLMLSDGEKVEIGTPVLAETVEAEVMRQGKAPRIMVRTYKAKKRVKKAYGHRQPFTQIRIMKVGTETAGAMRESSVHISKKVAAKKKA